MEQIVNPARRLAGEVVVPGEGEAASQALVLAALAEGESRVLNVPPAVGSLAELLRRLGVGIAAQPDGLAVQGCGLRGFRAPEEQVDLEGLGEAALLLLALLSGQRFSTRIRLGPDQEECRRLLGLLSAMGSAAAEEEGGFRLGGTERLAAAEYPAGDLAPPLKLALLLAGLYAEGATVLHEPARGRDGYERALRQRRVEVRRRQQEGGEGYAVSVQGGQALQPCSVQVPGDLRLALPLVVGALGLKGSDLTVSRVAVRPGGRAFLDLVRQLGGPVEVEEGEEGNSRLRVRHGRLKATRVAGARAGRLLDQVALLAVLATQTEGEFIIRDVQALRQGEYDYLAHLAELLRQVQAKVGEFPEGLIIEGGRPLQGARIDTRQDPGLAQAFAVAGLLAEGGMAIEGVQCLEGIYPGFFAVLEALKEKRR